MKLWRLSPYFTVKIKHLAGSPFKPFYRLTKVRRVALPFFFSAEPHPIAKETKSMCRGSCNWRALFCYGSQVGECGNKQKVVSSAGRSFSSSNHTSPSAVYSTFRSVCARLFQWTFSQWAFSCRILQDCRAKFGIRWVASL